MNYEIQYPKQYKESIRKLETTDRGHAQTFHPALETLINNDAYLKEQLDTTRQQLNTHTGTAAIHVNDAQKAAWTNKAEKTVATASANGLMSAADKAKLNGIAAGAEVNQNAIQTLQAGGVSIQAANQTAQVEFAAGANINITGDNATKKIVISASTAPEIQQIIGLANTHINNGNLHVTAAQKTAWTNKAEKTEASASAAGLMSAADKGKLNGIAAGAEVNQNSFQTVRAGGVAIQANGKAAQVEFIAGENIRLSGNNSTRQVTISAEGGGCQIGTSAPANTKLLWMDTASGGILKYYNGSSWVTTKSVWG